MTWQESYGSAVRQGRYDDAEAYHLTRFVWLSENRKSAVSNLAKNEKKNRVLPGAAPDITRPRRHHTVFGWLLNSIFWSRIGNVALFWSSFYTCGGANLFFRPGISQAKNNNTSKKKQNKKKASQREIARRVETLRARDEPLVE